MREISETEIKSMTKEQNYLRGYKDGKLDVLDSLCADIEKECEPCEYEEDFVYNGGLLKTIEIIDKYRATEIKAEGEE